MSLRDFVPAKTSRACINALNAFKRWVASENVPFEHLLACIAQDMTASVFEVAMDKCGIHLAFNEGSRGRKLAKSTVMQYYRQTKNWLLEKNPSLRVSLEERLQKMARTLERHCLKREHGGVVKKAEACTKQDLFVLVHGYITTLRSCCGIALAVLQTFPFYDWFRAHEDVRGGLALYPDQNPYTCPLLSIALALLTQATPSVAMLSNLPQVVTAEAITIGPGTPLLSLLDPLVALTSCTQDAPQAANVAADPGIHAYVNRLLKRIAIPSGLTHELTSHSFRRGGAQHANGHSGLSAQWIFDRGAWNLSSTNKAFAYIFNTSAEDQKIAKMLSAWTPTSNVVVPDLSPLDPSSRFAVARVQAVAFQNCVGLANPNLLIKPAVLDILMTMLLWHLPFVMQT
ncbi:hypothetical protein AaE_014192 [Aphanomyces astaci]|uniref:Uncharacterized protein n=1 Tax=Aphanomyces astaci TaxID=112090 RepID=A0A6A4Z190_APHAT|nr:hypothetical protein AaE_014192 [Aphanomyces astaci]